MVFSSEVFREELHPQSNVLIPEKCEVDTEKIRQHGKSLANNFILIYENENDGLPVVSFQCIVTAHVSVKVRVYIALFKGRLSQLL